jgi:hypothetical protein
MNGQGRHGERDAIEDDGGSLVVPAAERVGEDGGANGRKVTTMSSRVFRSNTVRSAARMWSNMDVVVNPHLSDEQECDGVG